jgi:hypothetical protein
LEEVKISWYNQVKLNTMQNLNCARQQVMELELDFFKKYLGMSHNQVHQQLIHLEVKKIEIE